MQFEKMQRKPLQRQACSAFVSRRKPTYSTLCAFTAFHFLSQRENAIAPPRPAPLLAGSPSFTTNPVCTPERRTARRREGDKCFPGLDFFRNLDFCWAALEG
jgi:hypothetical protein